jgi:hypothetical protein
MYAHTCDILELFLWKLWQRADKLGVMLASHWDKPRVYIGCMKSGEVISDP